MDRKKKGVSQNGQTPNIIGICSYCVLDRPVLEWNQVLLHLELTLWWSFLFEHFIMDVITYPYWEYS